MNEFYRGRWAYLAALIAALTMLSFPAAAAEEEDSDDAGVIEEIVVSATYRDTRMMNTPLTISAITAEDIVAKGIEDIQTLYQSIPGLSYRTNSQTYNTLSIRGLTPPTGGGAAMVGVYMDNLPMTDSNSGGLSQTLGALFDMERVEVLKGPQGTLYGEGNMGGSLRYITKKPDPSGFDYSVQANMEDIGESSGLSYRVDAMVNIPLGEQLALRLVAYRRDRVGILDQVAPRNKDDTDTTEEDGYRVKLSWYATDALEISLMANVIDAEYAGPGLGFHCFTESTPSDPAGQVPVYELPGTTCAGETDQFSRDPFVTHLAHPTYQSGGYDNQEMYNLNIEWEMSFATLISSTSYFDRETDYSEETSPRFSGAVIGFVNAYYCFGQLTVCGPEKLATLGGDGAFFRGSERFVQELRLISNTDGPWQWTVGAYYKDDESQGGHHNGCYNGGSPAYQVFGLNLDTHCWLQYGFFDGVPIADQQAIIGWLNDLIPGNTSYRDFGEESVYGELSYRINDQWEILGGLRFASVSYDLDIGQPGVDTRSSPVNSLSTDSDITSPKVTLTWRPKEDLMIYATYSQGFRPGIVNTGLAGKVAELDAVRAGDPIAEAHYLRVFDNQTVDGDEVVNYELGIKTTLWDGRLSLVGSLYHIDWNDTIISVSDMIDDVVGVSPLSYSYAINGGTAESEGVELELRIALSDSVRLNIGGDYNWTAEIGSAGDARYGGVQIEPGNRLANAPKFSAYANVVWDFDLAGFDANARADFYAIDESWNTANNERPAPSYQTLDLKLTAGRDDWRAALYVRNIFDEEIVYEFNQVGYRFGRPRTLGLQFIYNL